MKYVKKLKYLKVFWWKVYRCFKKPFSIVGWVSELTLYRAQNFWLNPYGYFHQLALSRYLTPCCYKQKFYHFYKENIPENLNIQSEITFGNSKVPKIKDTKSGNSPKWPLNDLKVTFKGSNNPLRVKWMVLLDSKGQNL